MSNTQRTTRDETPLPMTPQLRLASLYFPAALLVLFVAYAAIDRSEPRPALLDQGGFSRLDPSLEIPEFALDATDKTAFTRDSFKGQWTLLALGFTSCPDICPTTLSALSAATEDLSNVSPQIQILFVSVDPERDSTERLSQYVAHFGEFVVGATGDHDALQALTKPLGLFYSKSAPDTQDEDYSVEHSTTVLIVNPKSEVIGLISGGDLQVKKIERAVRALSKDSA